MSDTYTLTHEEDLNPIKGSIATANATIADYEQRITDHKNTMKEHARQVLNGIKAIRAFEKIHTVKNLSTILEYYLRNHLAFSPVESENSFVFTFKDKLTYDYIQAKTNWKIERRNLKYRERRVVNASMNLPRLKQELRMKELLPTKQFKIDLTDLREHLLRNEFIHKVEHIITQDGLHLCVHLSGMTMSSALEDGITQTWPIIPLPDMVLKLIYRPKTLYPIARCTSSANAKGLESQLLPHPHWIHSETPCLGDFAGPIHAMAMTGDIAGVVYLYMAFLSQYDPHDSAGKYFPNWLSLTDRSNTLNIDLFNASDITYRVSEKPNGSASCPKPKLVMGTLDCDLCETDEDEEYEDNDDYYDEDICSDCDYRFDECICARDEE